MEEFYNFLPVTDWRISRYLPSTDWQMSFLFLVTDWWKSWAFFHDWSTNFAFFPITGWRISGFFPAQLTDNFSDFLLQSIGEFHNTFEIFPRSTDNFYDFSHGFSTNFAIFLQWLIEEFCYFIRHPLPNFAFLNLWPIGENCCFLFHDWSTNFTFSTSNGWRVSLFFFSWSTHECQGFFPHDRFHNIFN